MPRRPTKPPTESRAQPGPFSRASAFRAQGGPRPANHCRALVPVDATRLRKKIKKDYDKARRDLDISRQQIDQFQQIDQPQYTRWLHSHFGALLTELRELDLKIATDNALVFMVQNEVFFAGSTYARAYKRVMEQRENPQPPPPPPPPDDEYDAEPEPSGRRRTTGNPRAKDRDDPLRAAFDKIFGEYGPEEDPSEFFDPRDRPRPAGPPAHVSGRLKELYRAVVRRLHPDSQREMTAQKTEWWHQAQAAYEAGDVDQLEVILTLSEIGESGTTTQTSVSLLQRITAQLKSSLREIKRQLAQWRREPAWNFSTRTDHSAMADKIERDLTADLTALRQRWSNTQQMIAKWKTAAERLKPSRPRRPTPPNQDFLF